MIDIIKAIGVIDLTLIGFYAIAFRYTSRAAVPFIAFILTIALSFADMPQDQLHVGYAAIYIALCIFATPYVALAMLAYAPANAAALFYFLSSFRLEYFTLYFAIAIVVINLCIIFTIFKGVRSEQLDNVDHTVLTCTLDLCNLLTHKKQDTTAK